MARKIGKIGFDNPHEESTAAVQEALPGMAHIVPDHVDGLSIHLVEEFVRRFFVLDAEATEIPGRKNDLCEEYKERGLPLKTVKAAVAIVKAQNRAQASEAHLQACVDAVRRLAAQ